MKSLYYSLLLLNTVLCVFSSCNREREHTASAIYDSDSVSVMTSYGINTLVSDSGVIKYRIVTERWEVNEERNPKRWIFEKGLFLEQFDEKFRTQTYIQCDTAFYFTEKQLWELRGNVRILTKENLRYFSEQLFWEQGKHELYSNVFSRIITPERTLQGSFFRSNEQMTKYYISNTKGSFERTDLGRETQETTTVLDTTPVYIRPSALPMPKNITP